MRPIPKSLLMHTVSYYEKVEGSRYDNGGFKIPITISNVLFQPTFSKKKTNIGEEKVNFAMMIIDGYNTIPIIKPVNLSKIVYNGDEFLVKEVKELHFRGKLHHYEVILT